MCKPLQLGFPPTGTTGYYSSNATKADAEIVQAYMDAKGISGSVTSLPPGSSCLCSPLSLFSDSLSSQLGLCHSSSEVQTADSPCVWCLGGRYNTRVFKNPNGSYVLRQAAAEADTGPAEPLDGTTIQVLEQIVSVVRGQGLTLGASGRSAMMPTCLVRRLTCTHSFQRLLVWCLKVAPGDWAPIMARVVAFLGEAKKHAANPHQEVSKV